MSNKSSNKKVIVLLELDEDLAKWLKDILEGIYVVPGRHMIRTFIHDSLNATKIIGKIIEKKTENNNNSDKEINDLIGELYKLENQILDRIRHGYTGFSEIADKVHTIVLKLNKWNIERKLLLSSSSRRLV